MTTRYRVLCLTHDGKPAGAYEWEPVAGRETQGVAAFEDALTTAPAVNGARLGHPNCDLVGAQFTDGTLIAVFDPDPGSWVPASWLAMLLRAHRHPDFPVDGMAVSAQWTRDRLEPLAVLLGVDRWRPPLPGAAEWTDIGTPT